MACIGVTLELSEDGSVRVASVLPDGPASGELGLRPGDTLLCVAGISISGRPMAEVHDIVVGPPETNVTMILRREGAGAVVASLERWEQGAAASTTREPARRGEAEYDNASTDMACLSFREVQLSDHTPWNGGAEAVREDLSGSSARQDCTSIDSLSDLRTRIELASDLYDESSWHMSGALQESVDTLGPLQEASGSELGQQDAIPSFLVEKCEQLQAALDQTQHRNTELERRLSRMEDALQQISIKALEGEQKAQELQKRLNAASRERARQEDELHRQQVRIHELSLRARLSDTDVFATSGSDSRRDHAWNRNGSGRGGERRREDEKTTERRRQAQCFLEEEECDRRHDDHGAFVMTALIDFHSARDSTSRSCSDDDLSEGVQTPENQQQQAALETLHRLSDSADTATAVLAILALACLGQSHSDTIAQHCPSSVMVASRLVKSGGSRTRRHAAFLLCSMARSVAGRELICQDDSCLQALQHALNDKDVLALSYALRTVWHMVAYAGAQAFGLHSSTGPLQVASALQVALYRPGLDPSTRECAASALHVLQQGV